MGVATYREIPFDIVDTVVQIYDSSLKAGET